MAGLGTVDAATLLRRRVGQCAAQGLACEAVVLALVLNATNEPLSVVPARRAAVLVLDGKADAVHFSGTVLRSEHLRVEIPSVVRLQYYVRVPYLRRGSLSRRGVLARDDHRCQYCGRRADSIDHVRPRSRGGAHTWDNVVAACRRCNTRKRDQLLSEIGMRLHRTPQPPTWTTLIRLSTDDVPDHWSAYLQDDRALSA